MSYHERIASRILKQLGIPEISREVEVSYANFVVRFRWDGVGRKNGRLVLVEVEPRDVSEDHIRLHVTSFAILAYLRKNIAELIWVVHDDSMNCHTQLKSYATCWALLLEEISGKQLPPMKYYNRNGVQLD